MYSRTQVRSAWASSGVNSGVTGMGGNEYTAPPSEKRTGPYRTTWLVVRVCVGLDDDCLAADGLDLTAIERLRRGELDLQHMTRGQEVPSGTVQRDPDDACLTGLQGE